MSNKGRTIFGCLTGNITRYIKIYLSKNIEYSDADNDDNDNVDWSPSKFSFSKKSENRFINEQMER